MKPSTVIILGAGASFDYVEPTYRPLPGDPGDNYHPPLVKDLFQNRFEDIISKHPTAKELASDFTSAIRQNKDIETFILDNIMSKAIGGQQHRQEQLVDFLFYLHQLFQKISDACTDRNANNYQSLINSLQDKSGNAYIITFNYDTLIENAIERANKRKIERLNDYVISPIKLIKLHGSSDWVYPFRMDYPEEWIRQEGGIVQFLKKNFNIVFNNQKKDILRQRTYSTGYRDQRHYFFPALAIPLAQKDVFVCPENHIQSLREGIKENKKILVIGWKASDSKLLELIDSEQKDPIEFTIVSGNKEYGMQTVENIKIKIKNAEFKIFDGGFSQFVGSEEYDNFFK